MGKQILLEQDEIQEVVNNLTEGPLLDKFNEMLNRESGNYYKKKKGQLFKTGFRLYEGWNNPAKPLDYTFKVSRVDNIWDATRTQYQVTTVNRYVINIDKEKDFFTHKLAARSAGLKRHKALLEKKIKTLKTDKGKKPYLEKIVKLERQIHLIDDFPHKWI